MIRLTLLVFLAVLFLPTAAQEPFKDLGLKLKRNGTQTELATFDDDVVLKFESDTTFFLLSEGAEFLIFRNKGLYGFIDPYDLYIVKEAQYEDVKILPSLTGLLQLTKKGKLQIVYNDLSPAWKGKFDAVSIFNRNADYGDYYMLRKGKKYGLINIENEGWFPAEPKYNGIYLMNNDSSLSSFIIQKGKKYGAGDCEGIEVDPDYDTIVHLYGTCNSSYYAVSKNGKYGLRSLEPVYEMEYDTIGAFENQTCFPEYFFLKKDNKFDIVDVSFDNFKPRYTKVWEEIKADTLFIYGQNKTKVDTFIQSYSEERGIESDKRLRY